jgi:hypothetical protein
MPGGTLSLRDPRGGERTLPAGASAVELPFVGAYGVESAEQRRVVFANFFDAGESDIGRAGRRPTDEDVVPPARFRVDDAPAGRRPLAPWLLAVALVLFVGEWLIAWRPR